LEDSSAMKIETTSSDANTVSRDEASGHGWFRWLLKKFASSPPELNPKNEGVVQPSSIANPSRLMETRTNSIGMQFRLIRPGTFLMGSPESENGRHEDEMQHQVTLTRPFFLGLYPVTQEEYRRVMGGNPKGFKGNRHPMKAMNWKDAIKFIERLNRLESEKSSGRVYRLPTEAEWEYACRAGTATAYCFGNSKSELDKYAWYKKNSAAVGTRPVGEKLPNAWGLFDMHGNVLEWCSDWYGKYPHGAVTDPVGPSSRSRRVFRGGSYSFDAEFCRSAYRNWYDPAIRNDNFGFRLALEEEEEDTIYLALEEEEENTIYIDDTDLDL
jgi:formylglycine-generating enzyme required for sulfatase activity